MEQRAWSRIRRPQPSLSQDSLRRKGFDHLDAQRTCGNCDASWRPARPPRRHTARRNRWWKRCDMLGRAGERRLSELDLEQAGGVLPKNLHLGLWFELQGIQLFEDPRRRDERIVAAEERSVLQPAADFANQLRWVIARRPSGELDVEV